MILSLYLTMDCNYRCSYCYATPHRKSDMNLETAKKAVKVAANHARKNGDPVLGIRLFGGEPLLQWKIIPELVDYIKTMQELNGLETTFGIATNGSMLNTEICAFLRHHDFGVGISIDGSEEIHNLNRIDSNGNGTYRKILDKIRFALDNNLRVSLALVADPSTISSLPDSVKHIHEETGCFFFTISFNIHAKWTEEQLRQLDQAFMRLAEYYVDKFNAGRPVQIDFLNNKINVLLRGGFMRSSLCDIGKTDLAVIPEGMIYPCLRLAAMDPKGDTAIGTLEDGVDANKIASLKSVCDSRYLPESKPERCFSCMHPESCLNWCAATNLAMTGHPAHVGEIMCSHETSSLQAAKFVMANIDMSVYSRLYAEYLLPVIPRVIIPEIPHGELIIPRSIKLSDLVN